MFQNIRLGHATNSSSAHSVIFTGPKVKLPGLEGMPEKFSELDPWRRDHFAFRDTLEKATVLLASSELLDSQSNHAVLGIRAVLQEMGCPEAWDLARGQNEGIPTVFAEGFRSARKAGISAADWLRFMLSSDITIIGYDDNSSMPGWRLLRDQLAVEISDNMVWRQDGAAIVSYDRGRGTKLRWSPEHYTKSSTPELVDIKITDYCGYGCAFCYQGSTREGMHAPMSRIEAILDQLAEMKVFEVAIGGGEPSTHPEFAKILEAVIERGITPNFTAYGLDWARQPEVLEAMASAPGMGVGISVHSRRDLAKVKRARDLMREGVSNGLGRRRSLWSVDLIAQTVVGATPGKVTEDLVDECIEEGLSLILLGYKTTGRGAEFNRPRASDQVVRNILRKVQAAIEKADDFNPTAFTLSVDTAFLDQHGHLLDQMGVPHELRTSPEGAFSMYVDAVAGTCGPSSYCDPSMMEPIGDIRSQFAAY